MFARPVVSFQQNVKQSTSGLAHPAESNSTQSFALIASWILIAAGIALRLRQYLADTSFFSDEAALVLNFRSHTWPQLLRSLDNGQAAPPAFLWIGRAMYLHFGPNEYALRLLPLAGGLIALGLFAQIAWRLFPAPVAAAAVGWFAFCDQLISFCAELKQYSTDAMVAVILFGAAFVWGVDRSPLKRLARLSAVAFCTVWLSHPTVILYGAFALVLLLQCGRMGTRAFGSGMLCGNAVFVSFLVLYLLSIRHLHSSYLFDFWRDGFPNWSRPIGFPVWLFKQTYALFDDPYHSFAWIVLPLSICGAIYLKRFRPELLAALLLPIGMTALAACLRQYPYNGSRLMLFLFPSLGLLLCFGFVAIRQWLPQPWGLAWLIPEAAIIVAGAIIGIGAAIHPHYRSHIRPVVAYVRQNLQPGDAIYLLGEIGTHGNPLDSQGRHLELLAYWPDPPAEVHTQIHSLTEIHARHFWVVLAYRPHLKQSLKLFDEFNRVADPIGKPMITEHGAAACRYELRQTP